MVRLLHRRRITVTIVVISASVLVDKRRLVRFTVRSTHSWSSSLATFIFRGRNNKSIILWCAHYRFTLVLRIRRMISICKCFSLRVSLFIFGISSHHHRRSHLTTIFLTCLSYIIIMVVSHKQLLYTWSFKQGLVLLHLFSVCILPVTICVFSIEVICIKGRNERS